MSSNEKNQSINGRVFHALPPKPPPQAAPQGLAAMPQLPIHAEMTFLEGMKSKIKKRKKDTPRASPPTSALAQENEQLKEKVRQLEQANMKLLNQVEFLNRQLGYGTRQNVDAMEEAAGFGIPKATKKPGIKEEPQD